MSKERANFWIEKEIKNDAEQEARRNGVTLTAWLTILITRALREAKKEEVKAS